MSSTTPDDAIVYIVDDDSAMRDALQALFASVEIKTQAFESGDLFLEEWDPERKSCIVLDVRMPGMSGYRLQDRLKSEGHNASIIFLTGYGKLPMAVQAMRLGAVDFMEKPVNEDDLLQRVKEALAAKRTPAESGISPAVIAKIESLTSREREVLQLVVDGKSSREIADHFHRAPKTVEYHRQNIMRKLGVSNVAELVRIVTAASTAQPSILQR